MIQTFIRLIEIQSVVTDKKNGGSSLKKVGVHCSLNVALKGNVIGGPRPSSLGKRPPKKN